MGKYILSIINLAVLLSSAFIFDTRAETPATKPAALKNHEVQTTDAKNIGERIELIATADSAEQLKQKTKPMAVVVQPDNDRTFFFWRDDKGAWSMAEMFQYDADGKKAFAIGKQIPDKRCPLPPVFLMTQFPVRKVKHLESVAQADDGCGTMPSSNDVEWVAWSEFSGGTGAWIYQQIIFIGKDVDGRWVSRGQGICDGSGRCGWSLNICSNTEYTYDKKSDKIVADHSDNRYYAITPDEGPTRLEIITHSQSVIAPEGNRFTVWPHLKVFDLEQYKDKYMGGTITLDSVADLLAFADEPFDENKRQKEKAKVLEKLRNANPDGIQGGKIYLK